MSTTSASNNDSVQTTGSIASINTSESLEYVVTHVFLSVQPPNENDYTPMNDRSLAQAVCAAAHAYTSYFYGTSEQAQWHCITKILDNLQASVKSQDLDASHVMSQLQGMQTGGALADTL